MGAVTALAAWPIIRVVLIIVICLILGKIVLSLTDKTVEKLQVEPTIRKFFRNILRVIIYAVTILVAAGSLGFEISSLVALISVFGAALALAAQGILSNFFGGLLLMFTHPIRVGEYVSTAAGDGTVREIGLLNTTLVTMDNRVITAPNGALATSNITNLSRGGKRRVDIDLSVCYSADMEQVKAIMQQVMAEHPLVVHDPEAPFARVTKLGESAVTYTARAWCEGADYWTVYFDLLENMKLAFDKAGVKIPYNQLDVHVVNH